MVTGSLTSKLRPIRIGFVISPWDRAAALEAMRISSFLWGGTYNPIIPYHQRLDRRCRFFMGAKSAQEVFDGYLQAYDPDFVVRLGAAKNAKVNLGTYREIDGDTILGGVSEDGTPRYGVGLFEILSHLLDEEFRFVRRDKVAFDIPDVQDNLLWTSIFGGVPPSLESKLEQHLKQFPDYRRVPCVNESFHTLFRRENQFIRRLTNLDIDCRIRAHREDWIYLMDGNNVEDVVFYWNLRALGWKILPIPMASRHMDSVRGFTEQFVEDNHGPYRNNPSMFNHTTLLKAPSVDEKDHEAFLKSLRLEPTEDKGFGKVTRQTWIPRLWNEWDRHRNGGARGEVTADRTEVKLAPGEDCFHVPSLLPEFSADYSYHGTPRCANELEPRIYGDTGTFAEAIPQGGDDLVHALGSYPVSDRRCSSEGLVLYVSHRRFDHRLELPKAEPIFKAWFKERGWNVELSDNGYIVKQVLKQFGGLWGTNWLTEERVLKLLHDIALKKWLDLNTFRALVHQAANQIQFADAERLTKWLVDSKIIQLGIQLICPRCRQRSWYSIADAAYEVRCDHCLELFMLPTESPKEIRWAYRGHGAFTSKHGTQGGLAVILTLRSFKGQTLDQVTPMLSFNACKEDQKMEVDLALHIRCIRSGLSEQNVLFAECKSYNEFERSDVEKMERFVQQFPSAAMVFSTLRRELSKNEVNLLTSVAKRAWRASQKGNAFSPLVILTGNELFSSTEPRSTWRQLGGRFERFANYYFHEDEMKGLADATQFLYLGFDSNDYVRRLSRR